MAKKEFFDFPNVGYLLADVPPNVKNSILREIEEIKNNSENFEDYRSKLAGHLSGGYKLEKSISDVSNFALPLIMDYQSHFDYIHNALIDYCSEPQTLVLDDMWVNFQKKGEFNPMHTHSGVFSFVIWVKIPYDIKKELEYFGKPRSSMTSMFLFSYTNSLGNIMSTSIPVDKNWEWKIALFPAKLSHSVNPFYTSDDERISVSGNFSYINLNR